MANTKKLVTSVAAVAAAAVVLVGGTFAWQSISQTALNESSDVVNPGGRLHNDMWYVSETENNNDIYVENFGEEPIVARVRLSEYMEVVLNKGTAGETEKILIGEKTEKDPAGDTDDSGKNLYNYQYVTFTGYDDTGSFNAGVAVNDDTAYWTWQTGGETVYMPTFNMNKDSLEADLNGLYVDRIGGISNRGAEQYTRVDENGTPVDIAEDYSGYSVGEKLPANEIWDIDSNSVDELAESNLDISDLIYNTDANNYSSENVALVNNTHTARTTESAKLISMSDWLDLVEYDDDGNVTSAPGNYWVYDTDGWVYWSSPIASGTATGLLLDGITLDEVMDDTWYYAIYAEGQFVTLDDAGQGDDTGFYDTTSDTPYTDDYTAPSNEAEEMLTAMGVTLDGSESDESEEEEETDPYGFSHLLLGTNQETSTGSNTLFDENKGYLTPGDVIDFNVAAYYNNGEMIDISNNTVKWKVTATEGDLDSNTSIDSAGILTVSSSQQSLGALKVQVSVTIGDSTYVRNQTYLVSSEDIDLSLTSNSETYYTGTEYTFTASAKTAGGDVVTMYWTYSYESDNDLSAELDNYSGTFTPNDVGTYTISAWPKYMTGPNVQLTIDVISSDTSSATTMTELTLTGSRSNSVTVSVGESIKIIYNTTDVDEADKEIIEHGNLQIWSVSDNDWMGSASYSYEEYILKITDSAASGKTYIVSDGGAILSGYITVS